MKATRTLIKITAAALILVIFTGCANIPDIKPFADATTAMTTTLGKGYSHDEALLLRAIDVSEGQTAADLRARLKPLKDVWEPTEKSLHALAAYADALAALADAGKKGGESTGALFDSLNGLVTAVSGLAIPANVKGIAQAIGQQIIALRAEKDIKKAVNSVANIISGDGGIADILAQNFAELRIINEALGNGIDNSIRQRNRALIDYHDRLVIAEARNQQIIARILDFEDIPNLLRDQAASERAKKKKEGASDAEANQAAQTILNKKDALKQQTLDDIRTLDDEIPALNVTAAATITTLETHRQKLLDISKGHRAELDRIGADYTVVEGKLKEINELTRSGNEIFEKSQKAIKAWAKAHDSLRLVLEKKQKRVTVLGLLAIVKEIADALNKGDK